MILVKLDRIVDKSFSPFSAILLKLIFKFKTEIWVKFENDVDKSIISLSPIWLKLKFKFIWETVW